MAAEYVHYLYEIRNKHSRKIYNSVHALYTCRAIHSGYGWKLVNKEDLNIYLNKGWILGKGRLNKLGEI